MSVAVHDQDVAGPGAGGRTGDAAVWALICAWTAAWGWNRHDPSGIGWHYFREGAGALFGPSGLHVYADHPDLQIGPLAFLATQALAPLPPSAQQAAAQVVMTAAAPLLLAVLAPLICGTPNRRRLRLVLGGLILAPAWTVLSVRWMHLEDVLALLLSVLAVRWVASAVRASGPRWGGPAAGLALGTAIAAKPWAAGFVPILLVLPLRQLLAAFGVFVAVAVSAWLPFVAADGATLAALRPPVGVSESSGLRVFGYEGTYIPPWGRTAQLTWAPVAAGLAVLRQRWPGALLAAVAVRLALDPHDIGYYTAGAVVAALVFDFAATNWTAPWAALATSIALWHPFVADYQHRFTVTNGLALWWFRHPDAVAIVHLGWAAAAVLLVLVVPGPWTDEDQSEPSDQPDLPDQPDPSLPR
jgi:hypothetical protein